MAGDSDEVGNEPRPGGEAALGAESEEEEGEEGNAPRPGGDGTGDGGVEEDEEEEEVEQIGADGRPTGQMPIWEAKVQMPKSKGKEVWTGEAHLYEVGERGKKAGVILCADWYGWNDGRTRDIADYLAEATGSFLVLPKLLDEPPKDGGTRGDGLPPDYVMETRDAAMKQLDMKQWVMKYTWETFAPKLSAATSSLRQKGAKRIAVIGFGFGGWLVCRYSVHLGEFVGGVAIDPQTHVIEKMNGIDPEILGAKLKGPLQYLIHPEVLKHYGPGSDFFDDVHTKYTQTECITFPDVPQHWTQRAGFGTPGVKLSAERAILLATKFLRRALWPPLLGQDAATLRLAARDDDHAKVGKLLNAGVMPGGHDSLDISGLAPLHYAAVGGHVIPTQMLAAAEADPDEAGGFSEEAPIHVAAREGNQKAIKALIRHGADCEKRDKALQTPLHLATMRGHLQAVQMLIQLKADLECRDDTRQTPMHLAAWHGHKAIVRALLDALADVDPLDLRVQTPWKRARQTKYPQITLLIDRERDARGLDRPDDILSEEPDSD